MPKAKRKSNSKHNNKHLKKTKVVYLDKVCEDALKNQYEMKRCLNKVAKHPFVFRALKNDEGEEMSNEQWREYALKNGYRMITISNSLHTNQIFYLPGEFPRVKFWSDLVFGADAIRESDSKNFILGQFEITSNDYKTAMIATGFLKEDQPLPPTNLLESMIDASNHLAGHIYGLKSDDVELEQAEERVFQRGLKVYKQMYCPTLASFKNNSCEK